MSRRVLSFSDYERQVERRELALIEKRQEVSDFLNAPHSLKETRSQIASIRHVEMEVDQLLKKLVIYRYKAPSEFEAAAESLCQRCRELQSYPRDMKQDLTGDLNDQQLSSNSSRINLVESMNFAFTFPFTATIGAKTLLSTNPEDTKKVFIISLAISAVIAFHKKTHTAVKVTSLTAVSIPKTFIALPRSIANDFRWYYARQEVKNSARVLKAFCKSGLGTIKRASFLPQRNDPAESKMDNNNPKL